MPPCEMPTAATAARHAAMQKHGEMSEALPRATTEEKLQHALRADIVRDISRYRRLGSAVAYYLQLLGSEQML